jgi:hypothetical protein
VTIDSDVKFALYMRNEHAPAVVIEVLEDGLHFSSYPLSVGSRTIPVRGTNLSDSRVILVWDGTASRC